MGDVLCLKSTILTINQIDKKAIKFVKIADGAKTCTVGFVPWVQAKLPSVNQHINKFVQVLELYQESSSTHKRWILHQNYGMCTVIILDDIPNME